MLIRTSLCLLVLVLSPLVAPAAEASVVFTDRFEMQPLVCGVEPGEADGLVLDGSGEDWPGHPDCSDPGQTCTRRQFDVEPDDTAEPAGLDLDSVWVLSRQIKDDPDSTAELVFRVDTRGGLQAFDDGEDGQRGVILVCFGFGSEFEALRQDGKQWWVHPFTDPPTNCLAGMGVEFILSIRRPARSGTTVNLIECARPEGEPSLCQDQNVPIGSVELLSLTRVTFWEVGDKVEIRLPEYLLPPDALKLAERLDVSTTSFNEDGEFVNTVPSLFGVRACPTLPAFQP